MAQIRMMAWNIEVYGPEKYGNWPNAAGLVTLIGQTVAGAGANVFVVMELMSSVAPQICFSLKEAIEEATGNPWRVVGIPARPDGDRESYGLFWQSAGADFDIVVDGAGRDVWQLSPVDFPNNFSASNGRRAALATFRTTDTSNNFTVSVYHAPPNARAIQGLEALAETPGLYEVDNRGAVQAVPGRLLGGDYNLDVNLQPEYSWLTNPVPAHPPPSLAGQGAGTTAITGGDTHLMNMDEAIARWGTNIGNWSPLSTAYRNLQLDNIFYDATTVVGGGVIDLVGEIMNPGSAIRAVAETFTLVNPADGTPAFPNAFDMPLPLSINLNFASCAWMLARYGVSDHLPVFTAVTI